MNVSLDGGGKFLLTFPFNGDDSGGVSLKSNIESTFPLAWGVGPSSACLVVVVSRPLST